MFHGNQEQISENAKEDQRAVTDQEDGRSSLEWNQSFTSVQENIIEVLVQVKWKAGNLQISNEKFKGKSIVIGLKVDGVQLLAVKLQGKSFVMLEETKTRWRPKIRAKNKPRFNMKKILNPRLMKEKIIVIEDYSSQEEMEEEESLSS